MRVTCLVRYLFVHSSAQRFGWAPGFLLGLRAGHRPLAFQDRCPSQRFFPLLLPAVRSELAFLHPPNPFVLILGREV